MGLNKLKIEIEVLTNSINKINAVVCKLVNREDAEEAVRNCSRLKEFNKEELGLSPNSSIFINEHLTPFNSKLGFYCRRLKKKSLVKQTKSQKGVVKILIEEVNYI